MKSTRRTSLGLHVVLACLTVCSALSGLADPSTNEQVAVDSYSKWLDSLDAKGYPSDASAKAYGAFQEAAKTWKVELEQVLALKEPATSDTNAIAQVRARIDHLETEIHPTATSPLRDSAIEYVLEGYWVEAGEKVGEIKQDRQLLDDVIAGYAALQRKDWVSSSRHFRSVDQRPFKGSLMKSVSTLAASHPNNPQVVLLRADALLRVFQPDKCLAYLDDPTTRDAAAGCSFTAIANAVALIREGDLVKAGQFLRSVNTTRGHDMLTDYLMGVIALMGQREGEAEAEGVFKKIIAEDPGFVPARNGLALAYLFTSRYQDAIDELNSVSLNEQQYLPLTRNAALAMNWKSRDRIEAGDMVKGSMGFKMDDIVHSAPSAQKDMLSMLDAPSALKLYREADKGYRGASFREVLMKNVNTDMGFGVGDAKAEAKFVSGSGDAARASKENYAMLVQNTRDHLNKLGVSPLPTVRPVKPDRVNGVELMDDRSKPVEVSFGRGSSVLLGRVDIAAFDTPVIDLLLSIPME